MGVFAKKEDNPDYDPSNTTSEPETITKQYIIAQPTKGNFTKSKRLQLGKSSFDQTVESVDYVKQVSNYEYKNLFVLSTSEDKPYIGDLQNVKSNVSKKIKKCQNLFQL